MDDHVHHPIIGELMPHAMEKGLHVAKVIEITAESAKRFEDAITRGARSRERNRARRAYRTERTRDGLAG
jgi:hypothetical protein